MDLNPIDQETQQSASAAQLRAGFAALRFQGPLEKEFQEAYLEQVLPRGRISGLVALVLLLTLICIDFLVGDAASLETNTIRLGILVPILVLMLIAMHLPALKNQYTVVVAVGVTAFGLVAEFSCIRSSLQGDSFLLAGMVLVVVYACLFLGLFFNQSVMVATVLVTSFVGMGLVMDMPLDGLFYTTAILSTAAIISVLSAYTLEHALRTNYLETRLLNELAERDGLTGLYNRRYRLLQGLQRRIWPSSWRRLPEAGCPNHCAGGEASV